MNNRIGIIVILYNPSDDDVENVITLSRDNYTVVVDNSSSATKRLAEQENMTYIPLLENRGIAEAQNIGVRHLVKESARLLAKENGEHLGEDGVKYIVFLDQDSRSQKDYCERIVEEYQRVKAREPRLALLGPSMMNSVTQEEYRPYVHREDFDDGGFSVRHYMISSGSCVERSVIDDVGLNDEALFIDFVDFEWCWRAESKGYVCGITRNVTMNHHVGQSELKIGGYRVIISSPQRYYYQYRNHLWLCRRSYVPLQWKITTGIKHIARLIYLPWVVDDGKRVWKNMLKGIADSFR